jgi:hypothetical protein
VIIFYSNEKTKCVQAGFFNGVVVVVLEVVNYGCLVCHDGGKSCLFGVNFVFMPGLCL